jgi:plastocyanin
MVMSVVLVSVGFTVRFNVASESHPVTALVRVAVWLSVVVKVRPFQVYGSSVSHIVMSVVLVSAGSTVRFNVARESHPVTVLVRVAVWLSVVVKVRPFQVYGSSVSQMVISVVLVSVGSTVRFNIARESHPVTALVRVAVWLSVVVNVSPFQVYGSSVSHMVMSVALVSVGSTVRFNVANESHPVTAIVSVAV